MTDAVETVDSDYDRSSRRDRWKDAISRTKSKFKKERGIPQQHPEEFKLSDDVNDFLAAGRKTIATVTTRPVAEHAQQYQLSPYPSPRPSPRPSSADSYNGGQAPPRGLPIAKLDISQSQRFPNARNLDANTPSPSNDHLHPDYKGRQPYDRSQSFNSAMAKKRAKPRGLSVTFVNTPPTVIGEGGDEAEAPPAEISKARQRARSLSPYANRPVSVHSNASNGSHSSSPVRRKPVPPPSPPPLPAVSSAPAPATSRREEVVFQPKPMRRIQTGFADQEEHEPTSAQTLEMQLDHALRLGGKKSNVKDPFADLPSPELLSPSSVQESKGANTFSTVQPATVPGPKPYHGSTPTSPQAHSASPRSPRNPDLQQSRETSHKPPPPRVPNFYAEFKRQSLAESPQNEKQSFKHQVEETVEKLHTPLQQKRPGQSPVRNFEDFRNQTKVVQPPQAPEGWI